MHRELSTHVFGADRREGIAEWLGGRVRLTSLSIPRCAHSLSRAAFLALHLLEGARGEKPLEGSDAGRQRSHQAIRQKS